MKLTSQQYWRVYQLKARWRDKTIIVKDPFRENKVSAENRICVRLKQEHSEDQRNSFLHSDTYRPPTVHVWMIYAFILLNCSKVEQKLHKWHFPFLLTPETITDLIKNTTQKTFKLNKSKAFTFLLFVDVFSNSSRQLLPLIHLCLAGLSFGFLVKHVRVV